MSQPNRKKHEKPRLTAQGKPVNRGYQYLALGTDFFHIHTYTPAGIGVIAHQLTLVDIMEAGNAVPGVQAELRITPAVGAQSFCRKNRTEKIRRKFTLISASRWQYSTSWV